MTDEELLAEFDDLLRTMPTRAMFTADMGDHLIWLGRAAAIIEHWRPAMMVLARPHMDYLQSNSDFESYEPYKGLLVILHQARHELRMRTTGPQNVVVSGSMPFNYFDHINKIIATANSDILFVDPYLDAEFVSRYLPLVTPGVRTRLLTSKKIQTLLPAVQLFVAQHGLPVEVRSAQDLHDRFVFIDERECHHSGASFKDGAKKATTVVNQITDIFDDVYKKYQDIWDNAKVEP